MKFSAITKLEKVGGEIEISDRIGYDGFPVVVQTYTDGVDTFYQLDARHHYYRTAVASTGPGTFGEWIKCEPG